MADLSDVETALVATIAGAMFPGAAYESGAVQASTVTGATLRIFRGWPVANELDADLAAGTGNVSIFCGSGASRDTTRFQPVWVALSPTPPTLTVGYDATTVTWSGTCAAGQLLGVAVAGLPYVFQPAGTDTPATVAAAFAALIPAATSSGAVLTVQDAVRLQARVVQVNPARREVRRQMQHVTVTCWCPTPGARDALASAVDSALGGMEDANGNLTLFITLASGEAIGPLRYARTITNDMPSVDNLWRRDLIYTVEYGTTQTQLQPEMLFGWLNLNGDYTLLDQLSSDLLVQTERADALADADGTQL